MSKDTCYYLDDCVDKLRHLSTAHRRRESECMDPCTSMPAIAPVHVRIGAVDRVVDGALCAADVGSSGLELRLTRSKSNKSDAYEAAPFLLVAPRIVIILLFHGCVEDQAVGRQAGNVADYNLEPFEIESRLCWLGPLYASGYSRGPQGPFEQHRKLGHRHAVSQVESSARR